jgi:hypothetical protein
MIICGGGRLKTCQSPQIGSASNRPESRYYLVPIQKLAFDVLFYRVCKPAFPLHFTMDEFERSGQRTDFLVPVSGYRALRVAP